MTLKGTRLVHAIYKGSDTSTDREKKTSLEDRHKKRSSAKFVHRIYMAKQPLGPSKGIHHTKDPSRRCTKSRNFLFHLKEAARKRQR